MNDTIVITRVIAAPRARVYKAFLTPDDITHWYYATEGWTTPYARVDAKPGGEFHIGFRSPDGRNDFDFGGTYDQLVENESITYTIGDGRKVWVVFLDEGNKTRVEITLTLETSHTAEQQREGWGAQLVHLDEYLTTSAV